MAQSPFPPAPGGGASLQSLMDQAVRRHQAGDLQGAERGYRQVLAVKPDFADALDLLGLVALQSGHPEPALELIGKALDKNKRHPAYRTHEGMALAQLGRHADAIDRFERALKADKKFFDAAFNLGHSLMAVGRAEDAIKRFTRAAALDPANPAPPNALGTALMSLGRAADAEAAFRKAVQLAPDVPDARHNLATVLFDTGRAELAEAEARAVVALMPGHPEPLALLAKVLTAQDRPGDALDVLAPHRGLAERSLAFAMALGEALMGAGRAADALALYGDAQAKAPDVAGIPYNIGLARKALGDFDGALAAYDQALALDPDLADLRYSRAVLALSLGRFADGLDDYELRWTKQDLDSAPRDLPQPGWDGQPLAADETLWVWPEQGLGDHIIYGALLADTVRRVGDGHVVFECDRRLAGLFARAFPAVTVIADGDAPPGGVTRQVSMGGLMRALAPWPQGFQPSDRFLAPDPGRAESAARALAALGDGPKIGIAWRSARRKIGPHKSVPLDLWGPILSGRDATFVNLQYGETDDEVATARADFGCTIHTAPDIDRFNDIEGLAALIDGLDLVLTTSNVTAHIAGALGKPCWQLLQRSPIWYWGCSGEDVLFYPTLKAYRQAHPPEWGDVVDAVARDLDGYLG